MNDLSGKGIAFRIYVHFSEYQQSVGHSHQITYDQEKKSLSFLDAEFSNGLWEDYIFCKRFLTP